MGISRAGSETNPHRVEKYSWKLMLTTAGTVLGTVVPGLVGAGSTATLLGALLVGLISAFFTVEGPPTRAKAVVALLLTLGATILTISGFTLADLVRGKSVFGDRQYTFPVPDATASPPNESIADITPSSSPNTSSPMTPSDPVTPSRTPPHTVAPANTIQPATRTTPPATTTLPPPPTTTPRPPTMTSPTTTTPPTTTTTPGGDEVLEDSIVELKAEPGRESVEIDWWRKPGDGTGDLHMDHNGIFTALGAKLSVIADSPDPTRARCAQVQDWVTRIDFSLLHEGSQLCAQSRANRYAMLKVRAMPTSYASAGRFIFYGKTWALMFSP